LQSQSLLQNANTRLWSKVQPWLIHPDIRVALELLAARSQIEPELQLSLKWLHERTSWPSDRLDPPPLLTGADLIRLGHSPGPAFRLALAEVREMQLDGTIHNTADAIVWLNSKSSLGQR